MSQRVVIIGAGPGGLAAAMLLGKAGLDVTVLERRGVVGGRTSTLTADSPVSASGGGDFRFDLGPTFFLYPRVLEEVFAMCGDDLHRRVEMVRLDPQYRLLFENANGGIETTLDCTADVARMQQQIAKIDADDAARFPRFIADNRKKFDAFTPILQRPWSSLRDFVNPTMAGMLPMVRPWKSVDADLKRYFKNPRTRLAFSFQSKYLGMSPFRCPSLFTILSYLEYDYGVYHPRGGCGAVSDAMADAARDLGVTVELGAEVTALRFASAPGSKKRRCDGVTYTDGEGHRHELDASAVVVNADFAHAMRRLVPDAVRRRWTDHRLNRKRFSCSTYMLYLGVRGDASEYSERLEHHNIFLAHDYARNLDEIENRHVLSENPSVYVQHPGRTDPTMAPDGYTSLYVLAPVTHESGNVDWKRDAPRFRQTVLNQLAKLGLPAPQALEDRIVYEKQLTPAGWRDDLAIFRGATFNLAHNLGQMLHLRPRNRFEDVDGVYLVGGGTHPGSGLPVIYEGARISAKLVCDDLGISPGWEAREPATATPGYGRLHGEVANLV